MPYWHTEPKIKIALPVKVCVLSLSGSSGGWRRVAQKLIKLISLSIYHELSELWFVGVLLD